MNRQGLFGLYRYFLAVLVLIGQRYLPKLALSLYFFEGSFLGEGWMGD